MLRNEWVSDHASAAWRVLQRKTADLGLPKSRVAGAIGVSYNSLKRWLGGDVPGHEYQSRICELAALCSEDLGAMIQAAVPATKSDKRRNKWSVITHAEFVQLAEAFGSRKDLAGALDVGVSSVYKWIGGEAPNDTAQLNIKEKIELRAEEDEEDEDAVAPYAPPLIERRSLPADFPRRISGVAAVAALVSQAERSESRAADALAEAKERADALMVSQIRNWMREGAESGDPLQVVCLVAQALGYRLVPPS